MGGNAINIEIHSLADRRAGRQPSRQLVVVKLRVSSEINRERITRVRLNERGRMETGKGLKVARAALFSSRK